MTAIIQKPTGNNSNQVETIRKQQQASKSLKEMIAGSQKPPGMYSNPLKASSKDSFPHPHQKHPQKALYQ